MTLHGDNAQSCPLKLSFPPQIDADLVRARERLAVQLRLGGKGDHNPVIRFRPDAYRHHESAVWIGAAFGRNYPSVHFWKFLVLVENALLITGILIEVDLADESGPL